MTANLEDSLAPLLNCVCQSDIKSRIFSRKSIFVFYTVLNEDPIIVGGEWFVSFVLFQEKRSLNFPDGGLSSEFMVVFPSALPSLQAFRNFVF